MATYPEGASDVTTPAQVEAATGVLAAAHPIAVDLEADAMHAFHARLCFVQVGTDSHVFLFDTLAPSVSVTALKPALENPKQTKYLHAAGGDLQFLAEAGIRVCGLFDTHRAATLLGWPKVGLADLARDLLGVELKKEHQQSDFSLRPLPAGMRDYIADDVRYLCEIGRRVSEACATADIAEEVLLDSNRLAEEALGRPALSEFKPKIPKGQMTPAQTRVAQHVAQTLHQWRLGWAEKANVPMGRMLSNAALTEIATRLPTSEKDLKRAHGIRGQVVREHGEKILGLISQTRDKESRGELQRPSDDKNPNDNRRKKREELLKTFRSAKAAERKVTPSVVLTNSLVTDLADAPPATLEALAAMPYFGPKRLELYGDAVLALLAPTR